ncbi:hypothetical protein EGJ27_10660 [Pseudomonas sp. v388]|uniref:hypothetical protein n=1 Tax=Pseudomonas sp. v388 TaxID=2479849 RepID=UPI000F7AA42E|nr:hypothetical protein [Pseudomonas sp. v388]RRV08495.1 hypothetical protein EGJ27_10660 [Pseudomonas sp. v388]
MTNLVQSDLTAQKIRIELFCKRILIGFLIGLPVLSGVFNLVSWLRFGIDLPYLDDIRPYYHENAGSLKLSDLFTSSNDTFYPLGMALDSLAFRWLSGNSVAYQAISMTVVVTGILFAQWKLLQYCLEDRLLSAAAFSSLLFMLQPDSYWGLQNMAYHQALPLLLILLASVVSVSKFNIKIKCLSVFFLALASGLVYISGAFAFLAFALAMLFKELISKKRSLNMIYLSTSMMIPSLLTSILQGWVIVGIQHGVHMADTKMAYPWEVDFWIFIIGKVARSLYLPLTFPLVSLVVAICALVLMVMIYILSIITAEKNENPSMFSRVSSTAFPIFSAIFVYLGLVAAGRANLYPPSINSGLELFIFDFARFHFFWVCVAWPWVIAFIFAVLTRVNKVFSVSLVVFLFGGGVAIVSGTDIMAHDEYYKQTHDIRIDNLNCLTQGSQLNASFQCPNLHPGIDMNSILNYARYMEASFVGLIPSSPAGSGISTASYDIATSGFSAANLTTLGGSNRMTTGLDPMIFLNQDKLTGLSSCRLLQVKVSMVVERPDLAQLFYIPSGETVSERNSLVKPVTVGVNELIFTVKSDKGFSNYLRFDPVTASQDISLNNLEVRCLYSGKSA